ncbi:MAG: hypothetical protein ACT4PL_10980, partial [Phycisphaerales bacterium]
MIHHTLKSCAVRFALVTLLGLALPWGAVGQIIIRVNGSAPPGGDGQSWSTAYGGGGNGLSAALDYAAALPLETRDVEIWITGGVYKPVTRSNINDPRTASFVIPSRTRLVGGFVGGEARRVDRPFPRAATVFSGDLAGNDASGANPFQNNEENAINILKLVLDNDPRVSFHSITFERANNNFNGGGVFANDYSEDDLGPYAGLPQLSFWDFTDCTFQFNSSFAGGAIFGAQGSVFERCRFLRNRADRSSGAVEIRRAGTGITTAAAEFKNCEFAHNTAGDYAGVTSAQLNARPHYTNCTFYANSAGGSGGVLTGNDLGPFTNCIFAANTAPDGPITPVTGYFWLVNRSILQVGGTPGAGHANTFVDVIESDIQFADADGADYIPGTPDDNLALAPGSIAIDYGRTEAAAGLLDV